MSTDGVGRMRNQSVESFVSVDDESTNDQQQNVQIERNHVSIDVQSIDGSEIGSVLQLNNGVDNRQAVGNAQQPPPADALRGLKDAQVLKSETRGAIGANIATAATVGIVGGALAAAGKGAFFGGAVGSVFGPVGTIAGAVIVGGLVGLVALGIGAWAGRKSGKKAAAKITPDSVMQKYAPGSDKFNKLIAKNNKRQIELNPALVDEDPDIPTNIGRADQKQIADNFHNVLQARMSQGRPISKRFLEAMVVTLSRHQTDGNLTADDKQAMSDHLQEMLQARVAQKKLVTGGWIKQVLNNAAVCAHPVSDVQHLEQKVINRVKAQVQDLVQTEKASGRFVDDTQLARFRDKLVEIGSKQNLTDDQKDQISKELCRSVKTGLSDKPWQVDESFVNGVTAGLTSIAQAELEQPQKNKLYGMLAGHASDGFKTDIDDNREWRFTSETATSVATGLVAIAKSDLGDESKKAAFKAYNFSVLLERGQKRPVSSDFANGAATALITAEQKLATLENDDRFDQTDRTGISENFRNLVVGQLMMGQDTSGDALQELLDQLKTDTLAPITSNNDEDVHELKRQAETAANELVDVLADWHSSEQEIMAAVHKLASASRLHRVMRQNVGLKDDGQPNLRSNHERRRGGQVANDDYTLAFSTRFEEAIARRNLDKSQAASLYHALMQGSQTAVPGLLFAKELVLNDNRVKNQYPQDVFYQATTLFGQGLESALLSLARVGGIQRQQVQDDMARISSAAAKVSSGRAMMKSFLESKVPQNLLINPQQNRDALSDARAKAIRQFGQTDEYKRINNFRFDINSTPIDLVGTGFDSDRVGRSKSAVLNTIPRMISTARSMEKNMLKHAQQ